MITPKERRMGTKQLLLKGLWTVVTAGILLSVNSCSSTQPYRKTPDGVVVTLNKRQKGAHLLRLQVINDHIIRVTASPTNSFSAPPSLMISLRKQPPGQWTLQQKGDHVLLRTSSLTADVALKSGQIQFMDTTGRILLTEARAGGRTFVPDTVEGVPSYKISQVFDNLHHDALYGLGENQLGLTNLRGKDILLAQHNSEAFVPFFVSSGNYGVLWDNNSITRFGDPGSYEPLDSLRLFNKNQQPGGLTATYLPNLRSNPDPVIREEKKIDYAYLNTLKNFPPGFSLAPPSTVEWQGYIASPYSGTQRFMLYAGGYIQLWIDGKLLADKWRQCWNPAETLVEVPMERNKRYSIRVKWIPDGDQSFISLKWKKPLPASEKDKISLASEMGPSVDYYFIAGKNIDSVISGYRALTGKAPIMPLWAYGFWQSREHYDSAKEILDIVREFRQRKIPLDNIVQDWFYWKKDQWGSQEFDSTRYPDPKGMIDSLHDFYHTHFMLSVWPKFYVGSKPFKKFWDKGWLYKKNVVDSQKDWVGYVSTFYDTFNPDARGAFWDLVNRKLFSLGVDAWWLDATEPDILSNTTLKEKKQLMDPTALGPSAETFNAYPLENARAFYTGQRKAKPHQRVFILTRSAFAGSQRYAASTWSGDIGATWQDMKNQIATGISFSISGIPYWTMDIGGFATESRYQHPDARDLAEWREQMTRWYQFGAFCPLFRAHGQAPYREIFNVAPENSDAYQSMLYYDRLRYRLMPYIYSLAGETYLKDYTIMRGLVMDFESDSVARNLTDEYLFGPDLLINPVYTYKARTRPVYLPSPAGWYNLYNGKYFQGGQTISADAPYARMPVFVKAGAILPFGPALQYTGQEPADTITLYVYQGKDGQFNLYEDEGVNYNYEKGDYTIIPLSYNDQNKTLTIGKRKGNFQGMLQHRVFRIKWIGPEKPEALDFTSAADETIPYNGKKTTVKMK